MSASNPNNDPEKLEMKHFISNITTGLIKSKDSSLILSVLRDVTSARMSQLLVSFLLVNFQDDATAF